MRWWFSAFLPSCQCWQWMRTNEIYSTVGCRDTEIRLVCVSSVQDHEEQWQKFGNWVFKWFSDMIPPPQWRHGWKALPIYVLQDAKILKRRQAQTFAMGKIQLIMGHSWWWQWCLFFLFNPTNVWDWGEKASPLLGPVVWLTIIQELRVLYKQTVKTRIYNGLPLYLP